MKRLLIANRGEIALRIARTCRRLGIETVGIYAEGEAGALHARAMDASYSLGIAGVAAYLDEARIVALAKEAGADAIHPGFGFLSERASFAKRCVDAGLLFVGPRAEAIAAMGDKAQSKERATAAGVPTMPSFVPKDSSEDTPARWKKAAKDIGLPLLLKASAGGGGKGMRIVRNAEELDEALAACRREAKASFGDEKVLAEKYLEGARHVEVQVFGDKHGNVVTLLERDCSLQRRHQKVFEECPAPGLSEKTRQTLADAATKLAKAIGYDNAGTVECLVDREANVYFLEMNTRLQVEHPVTELVCGVDLVEWQLRVAEGAKVPVAPVTPRGHAVEVRLYAEDASRGFLPAPGTVTRWFAPTEVDGVRWDGAVEDGTVVSPSFDPMLGKVIAWGATRQEALVRLDRALRETAALGLTTNRDFLRRLIAHERVTSGNVATDLLPQIAPELGAIPVAHRREAAVLATAFSAWASSYPDFVPAGIPAGFRNNPFRYPTRSWHCGEEKISVEYWRDREGHLRVRDGAEGKLVTLVHDDGRGTARIVLGEKQQTVRYVRRGTGWAVATANYTAVLEEVERFPRIAAAEGNAVLAPMAGRVTKVLARAGATVEKGTPLFVLEAMKMEQTIVSPRVGVVEDVRAREGETVELGACLLQWKADAAKAPAKGK